MLQQTQVATVTAYYKKWMRHFPAVEPLARASQSGVMKCWAGLGYYRRARMIHEAAKVIVKNHGGKLPGKAAGLMKLPGIGRYTAGAIASIAFGEKTPVLDGNVIRVLTRLAAYCGDIGSGKTIARLWKIAESLVPANHSGDFNQAMMELGATVCLPENPKCVLCPAARFCQAHGLHRETDFPVKRQKEISEKIRSAALILRRNGKVLVERQPQDGRWGGLWMFPFEKDKKSLVKNFLLQDKNLKHRLTVFHGFTKYRVRLDVFEGALPPSYALPVLRQEGRVGGGSSISHFKWVKIPGLAQLAFPSPHQKIVKGLLKNDA